MKLSEKMKEKQLLSFELFPPKTEKGMANLPGTIEHLMEFKPEYISVTYGAGGGNVGTNREVCQMVKKAGAVPVTHFTVIKNTKEGIKDQKNFKIIASQTGEFTQAKGQEVMEDFLEKYDDIDVVISENDNMTFGVIDALEAAGKKMGTDGDVIVISFDAVKDALTVMQDEKIMADFECNPLTAPLVEQTIRHMENGEEVDKVQYVEEGYFDYTMDLKSILKDRSY